MGAGAGIHGRGLSTALGLCCPAPFILQTFSLCHLMSLVPWSEGEGAHRWGHPICLESRGRGASFPHTPALWRLEASCSPTYLSESTSALLRESPLGFPQGCLHGQVPLREPTAQQPWVSPSRGLCVGPSPGFRQASLRETRHCMWLWMVGFRSVSGCLLQGPRAPRPPPPRRGTAGAGKTCFCRSPVISLQVVSCRPGTPLC